MNPDIMETAYVLQVSENNLYFLVSIKFGIFGFSTFETGRTQCRTRETSFSVKNAREMNPPAKGLKSATFT